MANTGAKNPKVVVPQTALLIATDQKRGVIAFDKSDATRFAARLNPRARLSLTIWPGASKTNSPALAMRS